MLSLETDIRSYNHSRLLQKHVTFHPIFFKEEEITGVNLAVNLKIAGKGKLDARYAQIYGFTHLGLGGSGWVGASLNGLDEFVGDRVSTGHGFNTRRIKEG
jgi:hypothetical protein